MICKRLIGFWSAPNCFSSFALITLAPVALISNSSTSFLMLCFSPVVKPTTLSDGPCGGFCVVACFGKSAALGVDGAGTLAELAMAGVPEGASFCSGDLETFGVRGVGPKSAC